MWETLSPPWQACLELAWEAYCDDSIYIGAVVTGADGVIIARGRNRLHGERGADGRIYGNPCSGELRQMREMGLPAANVIEKQIGYIETHR
jgi:hypothetical protein